MGVSGRRRRAPAVEVETREGEYDELWRHGARLADVFGDMVSVIA